MTLTTAQQRALAALSAARWRIAILLTAAMMVLYFGFILLVAFDKALLGRELAPGLSLGILLGTLVIFASWMLIWAYTRWANTHYDRAVSLELGFTTNEKPPFKYAARTRVGFSDTDAQGIVYYGRYVPYFDLARVDPREAELRFV